MFREKAMYVKWPPDAEGAEKPKNESDKSRLLVREFNKKLTYRNGVLGGSRTLSSPHLSPPRPPSCIHLPTRPIEMDLRARKKGMCGWSEGKQEARYWKALASA